METIGVGDLPLLYEQIKELRIQELIDESITPHGNWSGTSIGHVISLWLCFLLSESEHQLSHVEDWAAYHLLLLQAISGQPALRSKDFTDDRLEQALDYLSQGKNWLTISNKLNKNSLEVYDLDEAKTVRLDAAPMQGHHKIKEEGLFQYGYSKHHNGNLGQLKIMLASVDNKLNGFGYPLAHMTVSGEQSDDVLYIPILQECEATFAYAGLKGRKLYVGDGKMGSIEIRYHLFNSKNDYLVPLSKIQLSDQLRRQAINEVDPSTYKQVYKTNKLDKQVLVASGFEQTEQISYTDEKGEIHQWTERRIFVLSTAYATAQQKSVDTRLLQAELALNNLLLPKQGKASLKTKKEVEQAVTSILSKKKVSGLLDIDIQEKKHKKPIRAYMDRPARVEKYSTFTLSVNRKEETIRAHKKTLGWQVYGTTAKEELLNFESCVWKYRCQNRVESRFHDLRNKVIPLIPIFVQKDNRVEALINLLMVCLKICAVMEYKVAKQLQENKEELANIFEGNPKRSTATPTAKRLLKPFKDVALSFFGRETPSGMPTAIGLTNLNHTQLEIIELLGFNPQIYYDINDKMKILFLTQKISET